MPTRPVLTKNSHYYIINALKCRWALKFLFSTFGVCSFILQVILSYEQTKTVVLLADRKKKECAFC